MTRCPLPTLRRPNFSANPLFSCPFVYFVDTAFSLRPGYAALRSLRLLLFNEISFGCGSAALWWGGYSRF